MKPISIKMSDITIFENAAFDVVKFDVEGSALKEYHDELSELPNSDAFSNYTPHCTICYVNKGAGKKYCGKLDKPFNVTITKIKYSKIDGTEKFYDIG